MDNATPLLPERNVPGGLNGSIRKPSPVPCASPGGRPSSLMDPNQSQPHIVQVLVVRDEKGYGMKVSGDNPVYVQSVKAEGAAEKAGLHAGDKIIKVNGVTVTHSTHTDVVALIRASSQVLLTVQQRSSRAMTTPSLHNRPVTTPTAKITGPQPVDHAKQYQLQLEKEQHYKLMIEQEQHYVDLLRSQIASSPDEKKFSELAKIEKNLHTLQTMLSRSQSEQSPPSDHPSPNVTTRSLSLHSPSPFQRFNSLPSSPNGNSEPPPLPERNPPRPSTSSTVNNKRVSYVNGRTDINSQFLNNEINANVKEAGGGFGGVSSTRKAIPPLAPLVAESSDIPPPLPPRNPQSAPVDPDAVNSINKQMSYPLVATCATLVNHYSPNPTHHRTKSSPESLLVLSGAEASKKLIASESMSDLSRPADWDTPPGTPPPPYLSGQPRRDRNSNHTDDIDANFDESNDWLSPDVSPIRNNTSNRIFADCSPIHAANPQMAQQPIISMEDDEISDQEISQLEDHGYFKSLNKLWDNIPHLAVFTNYILSNSDPNSLLFMIITEMYKEGNAKEMRKWAFEIHSCFLVPGAPLRLSNVGENIAREIDDVLLRESDKEEILRKIFWKSRAKAKEELTKQLADFQQKRTAGLGTIFGPTDQALSEVYGDKSKEARLYESLFIEKWDAHLDEVEKENCEPKKYYTAAALTTVFTRLFSIRPGSHSLDRCPTFVNKEKSFRTKLIGKSRKLSVLGHHFIGQYYYTVILCNYCHQIIYGIGPQGYQCSACLINLHRQCVKLYDDTCPGPMTKKDRGLGKFIRIRHDANEQKKKQNALFLQMEKDRRLLEDSNSSFDLNESGEVKTGQPVTRSGSDRRPDAVREENLRHSDQASTTDASHDACQEKDETLTPDSTTSLPGAVTKKKAGSNINRSESVKEQSEKRKQRRHMSGRNISDPSHNNTSGDVELERHPGLSNTESGSSSNSSISFNGRLSESPSNSVDPVASVKYNDSEMDDEVDPINWQELVSEEDLKSLNTLEKKRQDVINELFLTEGSHVRNLMVLKKVFFKPLQESHLLKPDELHLIFPNIDELLDIHTDFNKEMKRRRKEDPIVKNVGDMLVKMFENHNLQKAAATFCEKQQLALEFIKDRRKRDSKFDGVLSECEKDRKCRRLPLQGIMPTEMQRLSKYPLLLERLISSVEGDNEPEEFANLRRAHQLSKDVLNYVNEATKLALNRVRLEEIQKHLDTSIFERSDHSIVQDFRSMDLTKYKLILEGGMQLRRPNKGLVPVHILLLEEAVIILHREGERYLLKFFQSGNPAQTQPLSPIIKMSTLLVRANAVCKNALFLVNTSTNNSQMYDLKAEDDAKRDWWFKHFADASNAYNSREGKSKRHEPNLDFEETESVQDLPLTRSVGERAESVGGGNSTDETANNEDNESISSVSEISAKRDNGEPVAQQANEQPDKEREETSSPEMVAGGGVQTTRVSAEEWPLIQPSQVNVAIPPVHIAETKLTLIEQIRRKDTLVKDALGEKERMMAELLNIPMEDYSHIVDMASTDTGAKDLSDRILAVNHLMHQLQLAVNDSLNVSESEAVTAKGGKNPTCSSHKTSDSNNVALPSVPTHIVQTAVASLCSQLTTLWSDIKEVEEERDRLRKELNNRREFHHEQYNLHNSVPPEVESDLTTECILNNQLDDNIKESSAPTVDEAPVSEQ